RDFHVTGVQTCALPISTAFGFASSAASASIFMYDDVSDLDTETKTEWDASAELGLLFTSGNTETETFKAKLNLARDVENWRHKRSEERRVGKEYGCQWQ